MVLTSSSQSLNVLLPTTASLLPAIKNLLSV
jgi:hypothetical protein